MTTDAKESLPELCNSSCDVVMIPTEPSVNPLIDNGDEKMSTQKDEKIEIKSPEAEYKIPTTQEEFKAMFPRLKILLKEYDSLPLFKICSPLKGCGTELHRTQFNVVRKKGNNSYLDYICRMCMQKTRKRKTTDSLQAQAPKRLRKLQECQFNECKMEPTHGIPKTGNRSFCKAHAAPGMIIVPPECQFDGCKTQPRYGIQGTTRRLFCKAHVEPGMVMISIIDNRTCYEAGCLSRPSFNTVGHTIALFCGKHKLDGMEDVIHKNCLSEGCLRRPNYSIPGQSPTHCFEHKLHNMVDVSRKPCVLDGCTTIPSYGVPGQSPTHCSKHKLEGMEDLTHKKCIFDGCTKSPSFNYPDELTGLYCSRHKEDDMIDVISKTCAKDECRKQPCFNNPGEITGLYCYGHKKDSMIDVVNKRCLFNGCNTQPTYGFSGQSPTRCSPHREPGQIIKPKRVCEYQSCKKFATFGIYVPERCEKHCQETDRNLVLKRCSVCNNAAQWDEKHGELCDDCGKRATNTRLRRQRQVKAWIDDQKGLPTYDFYDKALAGFGRLERPDFAWKTPRNWILLEVDEFQHKCYSKEHEEKRMSNITQGLKMPCIWIRFNPDDYRGKTSDIRDKHRLEHLVDTIEACLNLPKPESTSDILRVTYLFFDDFDMNKSLEFVQITSIV